MSEVASSNYIDNILSCGYLRSYQQNNDIIIPDCIERVIALYCKRYVVYGIGCESGINREYTSKYHPLKAIDSLIRDSDDVFVNGYGMNIKSIFNELYISNSINNKIKKIKSNTCIGSGCIELLSSGIANDTELFVYTVNNKLYKSSEVPYTEENNNFIGFNEMDTTFIDNRCDRIKDIKCGSNHTLFLSLFGNVYSIGLNDVGQCGLNKKQFGNNILTPQLMIKSIISIECGSFHNLLINDKYELIVSGYNYCGQLGVNNNDKSLVVDIPIINKYFNNLNLKILHIAAGKFHSLIITEKGKCYTFGQNGYGNLGNGKLSKWGESNSMPQKININDEIINAQSGDNHNLLLTKNNNIITFGNNSNHQCSMRNWKKIIKPYIISKKNELKIPSNWFIQKVLCLRNESMIFIDSYKRKM